MAPPNSLDGLQWSRGLQSGFIYHYAFAMIIGILVLLTMMFFA